MHHTRTHLPLTSTLCTPPQVHFYDMTKPNLPVHEAPDVDEMFIPLPFNRCCWVNVSERLDACLQFAQRLPSMVNVINENGSCLGAAVTAGELVLSDSGGRMMVSYSQPPKAGVGVFKPKEDHKLRGTDQEKELWNPTPGWWPDFGAKCAKENIAVDFFAFPSAQCELATIGCVAAMTGGQVYLYANFSRLRDSERLVHQIVRNLTRESGYAGMMILRCSPGIRVKANGYMGHFHQTDTQVIDLAGIDCDKTYGIELEHEGKINPQQQDFSYLQIALLYTTRAGRRRIRVHTLRLQVATTVPIAFKHADLDTSISLLSRRASIVAQTKGVSAAWAFLHSTCVDILAAYRQHVATSSPNTQLVLPEAMKHLPIFSLAIAKSPGFRPLASAGTESIDERVYQLHNLQAMRLCDVQPYFYPRLYQLHAMHEGCGEYDEARDLFVLPHNLELTGDKVNSSGIYLMHDYTTDCLYVWVGERASPTLQAALFGAEEVTTEMVQRFRQIVSESVPRGTPRAKVWLSNVIFLIFLSCRESNNTTLCTTDGVHHRLPGAPALHVARRSLPHPRAQRPDGGCLLPALRRRQAGMHTRTGAAAIRRHNVI